MKKLWSFALVALLVPLAACGSSDTADEEPKDEPKETTTTTEAEADTVAFDDWVDEVNAICADSGAAIDDLGDPEDYADLAEIGREASDLFSEALDDIEAVGTPDDNEDDVETWLGLVADQADLYPDVIDAAEAEDDAALEDLSTEIDDLSAEARELAADLGLDECAKDDSTDSTDSTDTTEVSASDLSFDEWVVAADAVCADFETKSDEVSAGLDQATSVTDLAPAFEALIPLYEEFLTELDALGIPDDAPTEVAEWLSLISEGPERIQPLADAAAAGDEELFTSLSSELESYDEQLSDTATAIGFENCSQA